MNRWYLAVVLGAPVAFATTIGLGYALWLSRSARQALPDPSHLPLQCGQVTRGTGVILPASQAEAVYSWRCPLARHATPTSWVPTVEDVDELEARLPEFWESRRPGLRAMPLNAYVRQYAGFMVEGRKNICVNLVDRQDAEQEADIYRQRPDQQARLPRGVRPE